MLALLFPGGQIPPRNVSIDGGEAIAGCHAAGSYQGIHFDKILFRQMADRYKGEQW